jgi:hypothetical protein
MFAAIEKLIPMWSIPHCIMTQQLNSYTLETLNGLPLSGVYNSRQLRAFHPCEGTKLTMEELAQLEGLEAGDLGLGEGIVEVDLGEG